MDENQEVVKLATVATMVEAGKRVLMNMGDDVAIPYKPLEGGQSTGEWISEQFGAALTKALTEQKVVEAAR